METASLKTDKIYLHHSVDKRPDPASFHSHCHDAYEIIYVVHGAGRYVVEGLSYTLRPGTLLVLKPHAFHYVDVDPDHLYERYVCHFKEPWLEKEAGVLLEPFRQGEYGHFYSAAQITSSIAEAFAAVKEIPKFTAEKGELLAKILLSEILLLLSAASPEVEDPKVDPLGHQVIRYLNAHLTEDITLDALARRFFVSKFYLCRAFREHNGVSVLQYLTEKRIILAKQLLEEGETAIAAAAKSGFGDYSSFYRAYRKILGKSPKENKSRNNPTAEKTEVKHDRRK